MVSRNEPNNVNGRINQTNEDENNHLLGEKCRRFPQKFSISCVVQFKGCILGGYRSIMYLLQRVEEWYIDTSWPDVDGKSKMEDDKGTGLMRGLYRMSYEPNKKDSRELK